jgi:signal transduction histidine kinase
LTQGSSPAEGAGDTARLDEALTRYAGFLAHQLAELVLLLSAAGDAGPAAGARTRLERMLADLRDLAPVLGERADVDLAALLREVAGELSEPGRQARVAVADDLLGVSGDPGLLRALLGHLMRDGLAASASGTRFTLSTAPAPGGRVLVSLAEDCGPERAAAAERRLVPFERPDGSGALLGSGVSGPAAARIVAAHGGELTLRRDGERVTAEFDLPASR